MIPKLKSKDSGYGYGGDESVPVSTLKEVIGTNGRGIGDGFGFSSYLFDEGNGNENGTGIGRPRGKDE